MIKSSKRNSFSVNLDRWKRLSDIFFANYYVLKVNWGKKILRILNVPSIMSCFILAISLRISRRISCFMASSSALVAVVPPEEVALLIAFSAMPFNLVTSISSAVEPKRLRPGLGDSEPLEDLPVGEDSLRPLDSS